MRLVSPLLLALALTATAEMSRGSMTDRTSMGDVEQALAFEVSLNDADFVPEKPCCF